MSINAIEQPTLPKIDRNVRRPEEIVEYLTRLIGILQENLLRRIVQIENHLLTIVNVGVWYSQLPNPSTGVYADGTWRLIEIDDNNFSLQHKVAGVWQNRFRFR